MVSKNQFITWYSETLGISKKQAKGYVNTFLEGIAMSLEQGSSVQFVGFGTFKLIKCQERVGYNPSTRQRMTLPAYTKPVFKAGATLKNNVK